MNNNKHPLRFNVGFLINQAVGATRDITFDFENVHLNPDLELKDFHGTARLNRTSQGIFVKGTFNARVKDECVRCLAEFEEPLHTEFGELYAFNARSVSESGLILPEDANIDLGPIVREYLLVEMPISPLCREDCQGLCPVCGEDLNVSTCEHQQRVQLD